MTLSPLQTGAWLLAALLMIASSEPSANAQTNPTMVSSGLASERVEVKVNYSGAQIVLFVSAPQSESETNGMVVALIGPRSPHTVIRQTPEGERSFDFLSAPTVFAIGAEPEVANTTDPQALIDAGLNAATAAIPPETQIDSPDLGAWRAAFVELKMDQQLYSLDETTIERLDGGLRRARMTLPPNAPPGEYLVRAVVFEGGLPVGSTEQVLYLVRGGMDATLFELATRHGVIYGFLAVLLGIFVGGLAAWVGRR